MTVSPSSSAQTQALLLHRESHTVHTFLWTALLIALCASLLALPGQAQEVDERVTDWPAGLPDAVRDADFYDDGAPAPEKVELGRLLFFDKILSGNQNISCATCHHSLTGTGDGLSLSIGEGGAGLGVTRGDVGGATTIHERVPRNAPPVFNLGAREFEVMFHDGRVAVDPNEPSGILSPAGDDLPSGLDNILAVQAMFPVTSGTEMAGQLGENPIADAADAGDLPSVWQQLGDRLAAIPEYVDLFAAAFDDVTTAADVTYVHAANAIAAFESVIWRFDNSPFDRHLRGDTRAMSQSQKRGMNVFYGRGECSTCHSGKFQTDLEFHAIAMPQIGPGKGDGDSTREDFGRERVTHDPADRYRFRTPTLRNVALSGPWGHAGSYSSLEDVVRHHLDPIGSLMDYDTSEAFLPSVAHLDVYDSYVQEDASLVQAIADANEMPHVNLTQSQFNDLMDFLQALTDPKMLDLRIDVPTRVPSGLPIFD